MRIAISSTGKDITSRVAQVFGRADCFIIFDTDFGCVVDILDNSEAKVAMKGAGVKAATLVACEYVDMVFSGTVGPIATKILEKSLISIQTKVSGSVEDVIDKVSSLCNK